MRVSACKMNVHKRCHRNVANNCGINAKEMAQRLKDMGLTGNILSESMRVKKVGCVVACKNIRFSSLFAVGDVSRGGMSATQRQKFHTDETNQCLHNKSGGHVVPNTNLSNFTCLLVDFGKVLCSSANELQQNSNASSREEYIPQILTVLLEILRVCI